MKNNFMKITMKLLLLSAMFGLVQTAQANDPEYPSVFNTGAQGSSGNWLSPMKLGYGSLSAEEPVGHFGLNFGGLAGGTEKYSWDMTSDSDYGSGLSLGTYKLFDWQKSVFSTEDLFSLTASECKKPCDKEAWNCGWGPVTDEYYQNELKKCGVDPNFKPVKLVSDTEKNTLRCEFGQGIEPFELSYKSIKDLIDYDCDSKKSLGDGAYCYCVLRKSGDPKNKKYTPLTPSDVATLESITKLDGYQRDVMEIEDKFASTAAILAEAFHSQDEDLKKLFNSDDKNQVCLPGSFTQLEAFLKDSPGTEGGVCGERGLGSLDNIFKLNVAQKKCAGSSDPTCVDRAIKEQEKGTLFSAINKKTAEDYAKRNNLTPDEIKAREHYNPKQFSENCEVRKDVAQNLLRAITAGGVGQKDEALRMAEQVGVLVVDDKVDLSTCEVTSVNSPDMGMSYVMAVAVNIKKYRNSGKSPDDFVAQMTSTTSGEYNLKELHKKISDNNYIIAEGVLKNHANTNSNMAKLIEMLDAVIPKQKDLVRSGFEAKLSEVVRVGFKKIEFDVLNSAIKSCHEFIKKTENMCVDLAKGAKEKVTPEQFSKLNPNSAARFAKQSGRLGSLDGIAEPALSRKLSQLRCANIVGDDELKHLAIQKPKAGDSVEVENLPMDRVIAYDKPDTSAKDPSKINSNPWAYSVSDRSRVFSKSDKVGIRGVAKAITATRKNTFKAPLAAAQAKLGAKNAGSSNTGVFKDTNSTVKNIANMSQKSLRGATPLAVNDSPSKTNFVPNFSNLSESKKKEEKSKIERQKKEADERLDVIAARLADLMESREANKSSLKEKDKKLTDEEKAIDPDYQSMLIEKLNLEREIAALEREKTEKATKKKEFEERLADIESASEAEEKQAAQQSQNNVGVAKGTPKKPTGSAGGSAKKSNGGFASAGGGGTVGSGGGGGGTGGGFDNGSNNFFEAAPYVIRLTQDQVTAIKQNFQLLEKPDRWVAGGKPPVIREGNIFYELEVRDGKIVVDALGNPVKKKALNGFNVEGLRKPASGSISDLPKEVDKAEVLRRRAASVRELDGFMNKAKQAKKAK